MPIFPSDYRPKWWLRNGHTNTLYTYFYRKLSAPKYIRERWDTSDGDFIDLDFIKSQNKRLVILSHGLEGNSSSQYIIAMANLMSQNDFDVCALNYRSCSGEMNHTKTMYHSGFTDDLHMIVDDMSKKYEEIFLVGFSLGGNMNLKYTTDEVYPIKDTIKGVISVSAPIDLEASSKRISSWYNYQYQYNFLKTLKEKMRIKAHMHPEVININDLDKVKTLIDFDEYFTGPLHDFAGAKGYYNHCNALQYLDNVTVPTLLISSEDDPFLTESCIPKNIAKSNKDLYLLATKYGGHVGFTTFGSEFYWLDYKILEFVKSISNLT